MTRKEIPFIPVQEAVIQVLRTGSAAPNDIAHRIEEATDNLLRFGPKPGGNLYVNTGRLENHGFIQAVPPEQLPRANGRTRTLGLTDKGKEAVNIRRKAACAIYDAVPSETAIKAENPTEAAEIRKLLDRYGVESLRQTAELVDSIRSPEKIAPLIKLLRIFIMHALEPESASEEATKVETPQDERVPMDPLDYFDVTGNRQIIELLESFRGPGKITPLVELLRLLTAEKQSTEPTGESMKITGVGRDDACAIYDAVPSELAIRAESPEEAAGIRELIGRYGVAGLQQIASLVDSIQGLYTAPVPQKKP